MNYYPFNVNDYAAHTAHLDLMEDLAYRRMLDLYYRTERPLPEPEEVSRLIRMRNHVETIRAVLAEFFSESPEGYRHGRCDAELERMQEKQAKAKASAAASVKARSTNAQRTLNERSTTVELEPQAVVELPTPTPTPTPKEELRTSESVVSRTRSTDARGSRLPDGWCLPKAWGEWAMDEAGMSREAVKTEAEKFADYWHAAAGAKGRKADWMATWRNWCRNVQTSLKTPSRPLAESFRERDARAAAERVAQATGGLSVDRSAMRKPLPFEAGYQPDVIEGESNVRRIA